RTIPHRSNRFAGQAAGVGARLRGSSPSSGMIGGGRSGTARVHAMATRIKAMPGCRVPDALIISGAGPYVDPWHDFPATSARLADIVRGIGCSVDVNEGVED